MKAVVFDMDGLMFDTERVAILAWDYAGEKMGLGKAGYMVYKTLGINVEASNQIWKEEFGDRYNQEELRKYTKEFLKNYYENNKVPVKQGLYVLLEYLKNENIKLAVASSSPRWEVEKHLTDAGVIRETLPNLARFSMLTISPLSYLNTHGPAVRFTALNEVFPCTPPRS